MHYDTDHAFRRPRASSDDPGSSSSRWSGPDDLRRLSTSYDLTSEWPFAAVIWTQKHGSIHISRYKGSALRVERTDRHVADMFMSHVRLTMPLAGTLGGAQGGRDFTVSTGQALAVRFDRPFSTVADGVDPISSPPVSREMDLRLRAFSVIDAQFADPELTPDSIAATLHVSPRSLFRAFEESGTSIGRLIQHRRLGQVAMALERESSTETIAALAQANGFHGADQLTRAFRKQFGTTPSEFRAHHRG